MTKILLILMSIFSLVSCSTPNPTNPTSNTSTKDTSEMKIHIQIQANQFYHDILNSYKILDNGVLEGIIRPNNKIILSSGTYILYTTFCPICP